MDEANTQDVNNPAESDTAVVSSTDDQTATQDAQSSDSAQVDPKTIPYNRFAEVNEKFRQTEIEKAQLQAKLQAYEEMQTKNAPQDPATQQKELVKEQLKPFFKDLASEMGFVSKDELVRQQQDQALEASLKSLEQTYSGKDGRPAFKRQDVIDYAVSNGISNPEIAYKAMHEEALANWRIEQAIAKSRGLKTETSDGSGSANAGVTDDDVRASALKGDAEARKLLFKRIAKSHISKS